MATTERRQAPPKRCEEYSMTRHGMCDRPLDERGQCAWASEHGDYYQDPVGQQPIGTLDTHALLLGQRDVEDVQLPGRD